MDFGVANWSFLFRLVVLVFLVINYLLYIHNPYYQFIHKNNTYICFIYFLSLQLACGCGTSKSGQMMRSTQKNIMDLVHGNPDHIFHDHHNQGRPHHDQTHMHMHMHARRRFIIRNWSLFSFLHHNGPEIRSQDGPEIPTGPRRHSFLLST